MNLRKIVLYKNWSKFYNEHFLFKAFFSYVHSFAVTRFLFGSQLADIIGALLYIFLNFEGIKLISVCHRARWATFCIVRARFLLCSKSILAKIKLEKNYKHTLKVGIITYVYKFDALCFYGF